MNLIKCEICNNGFSDDQIITGHGIRHEVENLIKIDFPAWNDNSHICKNDFNTYRVRYLTKMIEDEK